MTKIINFSENISKLDLFFPHQEKEIIWNTFITSELGEIYQSIPWKSIVFSMRLRKKQNKGKKPFFTGQGKVALMFLKSYLQMTDEMLIARINSDIHLQFFCGIYLMPGEIIKDTKLVSKIRCELAGNLDIDKLQHIFARYWKKHMTNMHVGLEDATCYESDMRYPTNVKLLWESCEWIYKQIKIISKYNKTRMPRSKYQEQYEKYLSYQRSRKKTHKQAQKRIKSLLYILEKLLGKLKQVEDNLSENITMPNRYYQRKQTIETILVQQRQMFETGESVKNRIVSISKNYIRPIVRGKETKPVEFGAKVNMLQVDGINFIEHISFNAFNESTRFKSSIQLCKNLFGKCTHIAGDAIYGTNANRNYATQNEITTNFVRKGRAGKDEEQRSKIRSILSTGRATRMEGSFGNEKNHYGLNRIKARTEKTEILWIFFGIHTANAVNIAKRKQKLKIEQAA